MKKMKRDSAQWAVDKIKHGNEVRLAELSPEEVKKFQEAKALEVQNWIREQAVRAVSGSVPRERTMRMRWILTYKENGKAKGRIVVLGLQDPDLLQLNRASPTMSRRTRQLLLTYASLERWNVIKGDVKGAFLQGQPSEEQRKVYAFPVAELADALGAPRNQPVQLLKAAYGLVNAPAEWFHSVCEAMKTAGFEQLVTEPCMWRVREWSEDLQKHVVVGLCAGHVDDFLFCGNDQSRKWQDSLSQIYQRFLWSPWEADEFAHCGVHIKQLDSGEFSLDHSKFCSDLKQIAVDSSRKDEERATEDEKSQLRGLLGGAQWRAYQTGPQHSAKLGLLQSELSHPTVKTLRAANKLCREIYQHRLLSVKIQQLEVETPEEVCFVAWCDAALGNRPNGGSTGGYVVAATSKAMLDGKRAKLNFVSWKSGRLHRIARSSLAAEVQAFSECEEELMFTRLQWSEMIGIDYPTSQPQQSVKQIPGAIVTDARSLYDIVLKGDQNSSGLGLRDKYASLEVLSILQRLKMCDTTVRWVHSNAQLADALTKPLATSSLLQALVEGAWILVEDPTFTSAKRLRAQQRQT